MRSLRTFGKTPKILLGFLVGLLAVFLFVYLVILGPSLGLWGSLKKLPQEARPLKDALLLYDLDKLTLELNKFRQTLKETGKDIEGLQKFSWTPFLGGYLGDAKNLYDFSQGFLNLGVKFTDLLRPYASSLGFKSKEAKEPLAGGQERLVGLTRVAPVLTEALPKFKNDLEALAAKLKNLDPNRYPEKIGQTVLRPRLLALKGGIMGFSSSLSDLTSFFRALPDLMGSSPSGKKNYLVIFQNDKELRPSGGFLTAYAVFSLDKGRLSATSASDSYFIDIDNKLSVYDPAPAIVQKYLKLSDNKLFFRDANLSPDYKVSMEAVERIWNRSRLVPKIDGIIALDTHFVESMVSILGEVALPGYEKFTKENVVAQLELVSNVRGTRLEKRQGRKDIIGALMQSLMQKAFAAGGKQYLNLLATGWQEASQKHLLFYFHDEAMQTLAEKYNFAGRVRDFDGDYLYVNDANFAGRKGNWFVKEEVSKETSLEKDKILTTLKIDYANTGKYDPDYNTGYRDYVRVFVPVGSTLLSAEGSREEVTTGQDLGKTYFAGYMAVDPLQKVRLTLKYETPRLVIGDNQYKLLVQKQPGTGRFKYEVKVGRKLSAFELTTDHEVDVQF